MPLATFLNNVFCNFVLFIGVFLFITYILKTVNAQGTAELFLIKYKQKVLASYRFGWVTGLSDTW
jgi:hypothetical protein